MSKFAVYANGTFWAEVDAESAEEAIQFAADEFGTVDVGQDHASTEGMTADAVESLDAAIKRIVTEYLKGCSCGKPGECAECAHGAIVAIAHKVGFTKDQIDYA